MPTRRRVKTQKKRGTMKQKRVHGGSIGRKSGNKTVKSVRYSPDRFNMRSLLSALPGDNTPKIATPKIARKRVQTHKGREYNKTLIKNKSIANKRKDTMNMNKLFGQMALSTP